MFLMSTPSPSQKIEDMDSLDLMIQSNESPRGPLEQAHRRFIFSLSGKNCVKTARRISTGLSVRVVKLNLIGHNDYILHIC